MLARPWECSVWGPFAQEGYANPQRNIVEMPQKNGLIMPTRSKLPAPGPGDGAVLANKK